MFNAVLTNGEKIRKLREELGITLEELACIEIQKSYLSMLENNKRNLTFDKAIIIARKINRIAQEKNIYFDFTISAKKLMEDEENQARTIVEANFKSIENNFNEEKANETIEIAMQYRFNDCIISLCKIATEYFFIRYDSMKAMEYAQKGLYASIESKSIIECIKFETKMVKNSLRIRNFTDSLARNKNILYSINANNVKDITILNNVNYNFAIIYKNMEEFQLALEYAYKVNVKDLNKDELLDLKIVIANCYLDSNNVDIAINEYKNLLKYSLNNQETKARIYRNIGECYFKKDIYIKAIKYIEECIKIRREIKSNYLSNTLVFISDVYRKSNEMGMCKMYLLESIQLDCNSEALEKLVDLYVIENNTIETTNLIKHYAENFNPKTLINLTDIYIDIDVLVSRQILRILKRKNI